jgi:hypothetical protein
MIRGGLVVAGRGGGDCALVECRLPQRVWNTTIQGPIAPKT